MSARHFTVDRQAELIAWAAPRIGAEHLPSDTVAFGLLDEDKSILAVGLLNHFHDRGAWIHFAAEPGTAWATPDALTALFFMAFGSRELRAYELGRVTARVAASNTRALAFALKLGFQLEGRERAAALDGDDVIILGMLAQQCPWFGGN